MTKQKKVAFWGDYGGKKPMAREQVYFLKNEPPRLLYRHPPSVTALPESRRSALHESRRSAFEIETRRIRATWKLLLRKRKKSGGRSWVQAYQDIVDIVGSPLTWPEHICSERIHNKQRVRNSREHDMRFLLLQKNLRYGQRFYLSLFLVSNGVNPVMIMQYFQENGSLKYDAVKSIQAMFEEYKQRSEKSREWYSFDLTNGQWETMDGKRKRWTTS